MNQRQKKKRTKRGGLFHYDKTLVKGLKKGYYFPWVSEQGPCPTCWCRPGQCLICGHCTDIFLDWNGPYGIVCNLGIDNEDKLCNNFVLDTDAPLMSINDRKHLNEYIKKVREDDFKGDTICVVPSHTEGDWDDDILKYLVDDPEEEDNKDE